MKRKLSLLATGALLLIGLVLVPLSPASAAPDVCVGNGTANTDNPVFYPPGPDVNGGVHFNFAVGGCLLNPGVHSGTVHGTFDQVPAGSLIPELGDFCGHSTGQVDAWGHRLDWVSAGSMLVLQGVTDGDANIPGGVGVVNAVPNAVAGESCLTGARNFLVTGVLVLINP